MRARLPWWLLLLWVVLTVVGAAFYVAQDDLTGALIAPALGIFAGIGALLASRRPHNPLGWLLMTVALLIAVDGLAEGVYGAIEGDPRLGVLVPYVVWCDLWVSSAWIWMVGFVVPLLFPDGRLPSRRWRVFAWAGTASIGVPLLGQAFGSRQLEFGADTGRLVANPFGIPGPIGATLEMLDVDEIGLVFVVAVLGAVGSLVLRLRRATGTERLQLRWIVYAMGLLLVGYAAAAAGLGAGAPIITDVGWLLFLAALIVGLPVAIGVAVMRYRLYDIDVIIKRTLVYGSLTASLLATYLGLVLVVRLLLGPLAGSSDLTVAGSTLAVAALFRPLRSRIQASVDRRFYRSRYDAVRTLGAFTGRLRNEVDLEALVTDLSGVVNQTMQPTHLSLWLPGRS